jgi:ATP synthase protein I
MGGGREKGKPPDFGSWRELGNLASLGITLVVATAIGLAFGYQLDRWLGTSPWLTMIFLLLGIVAGFINLFREVNRVRGGN